MLARSSYCALVIASLLNILTPELTAGTAEWLARCQTYEGGVAAVPGTEAHGGYTYCALAALDILGGVDMLDMARLWVRFPGSFFGF